MNRRNIKGERGVDPNPWGSEELGKQITDHLWTPYSPLIGPVCLLASTGAASSASSWKEGRDQFGFFTSTNLCASPIKEEWRGSDKISLQLTHSFLLSLFHFLEKLQGAERRGRGRRVSRSGRPLPGALDSARGTRGPQVPADELLWHAHPPSPALHSHPEN